ncbi:MAG: hypothetical protein ACPGXZ_17440 [Saprospiraceae bacterium]
MKFFTSFFALFLLCSPVLMAQFHYSYISDKRFQSPDELLGYEMKPNVIVYPNKDNPKRSREETLNPGDITFRATRNYLIIESEQFEQYKGAYSVNSINPEQYGFKLDLMNARNPSIQGHLKIILNGKSQIDAYIFKPSPTEQEVIFYQSKIPENLATIERAYFTDIGDVTITDTTLWGTTVYPFFELEKKQKRLLPEDSLNITFQVDTIVVNKKKNKKKAVHSIIIKYNQADEDGNMEVQTTQFPVKKIVEKESRDPREKDKPTRIEFSVKKLESGKIIVFLDRNRTVHSIWIGRTQYTMRGIR